jgi:hypothetical protein
VIAPKLGKISIVVAALSVGAIRFGMSGEGDSGYETKRGGVASLVDPCTAVIRVPFRYIGDDWQRAILARFPA